MRQTSHFDAGLLSAHAPASPRLLSGRPPRHLTITRDVRCAACWYNLRGLGYRGRCPECGTRYDAWRNIRRDDQKSAGRDRRRRYLRTITHEPIIGSLLELRAAAYLLIVITATGLAVLLILLARSILRNHLGW
ncbi:MAG: hypothetical protein ACK4WH_02435 [Phycisphaerales bacterium]